MERDLILIVGLACSGKTTLARLAKDQGHRVVHADEHRYTDSKWTRRSLVDFKAHVDAAITQARAEAKAARGNDCIVYESSLLDIHDPENARALVLESLLPHAIMVIVIQPDDKITCLGRLIDRSIGRANGTEPPGSCPETTVSRARLVTKFIEGFDRTCQALTDFAKTAKIAGCQVRIGPVAELTVDGKI